MAVVRRHTRPGREARAFPVVALLLALSLLTALPLIDGSSPRRASRGRAAEVVRLALQGRAADVKAWFEEHPESCANQRRLLGVAEDGGLAGGLNPKETKLFWSTHELESGASRLQVEDAEMARYHLLKALQSGNYGQVFLAVDKAEDKMVAIKKIPHVFYSDRKEAEMRKPGCAVLTEIELLQITRHGDDVMNMERVIRPRNKKTFESVYQVYEVLEALPPKYRPDQNLTSSEAEQLKLNIFQLFRGMHYMHTANLTHNDLRSRNTMLDGDCNLKIIDLGLGKVGKRTPNSNLHFPLQGDVAWYSRDMWMIGATILYFIGAGGRFRLAAPTQTPHQKAATIIDVLGAPSDRVIEKYGRAERRVWNYVRKRHTQVMPLREWFPNADRQLLNLVKQIMTLDRHPPPLRQLLRHKYFEGMDQSSIRDGPRRQTVASLMHCPSQVEDARSAVLRMGSIVNMYHRGKAMKPGEL